MTEQQERLGLVALVLFLIWYFFIRDNAMFAGNGTAGYVPPNYNQQNMTTRSDLPCSSQKVTPINRLSSVARRGPTFGGGFSVQQQNRLTSCCGQPTSFNP